MTTLLLIVVVWVAGSLLMAVAWTALCEVAAWRSPSWLAPIPRAGRDKEAPR